MHTDLRGKVAAANAVLLQVVIELCHATHIAHCAICRQPRYCTSCNCLIATVHAPCAI